MTGARHSTFDAIAAGKANLHAAQPAASRQMEGENVSARDASIVSVGVDYCLVHLGLRNEDDHGCDYARWDDEQEAPCQLRPLFYVLDETTP